jgi:hypothetical protein
MTQPIRNEPNYQSSHDDRDEAVTKPHVDVDSVYQHLETLRDASSPVELKCPRTGGRENVLYVDGITPEDVRQGAIGDCTAQACIASIARSPGGRAYLRSVISETRDGRGAVTGYEVKLFKRALSGYEPHTVSVSQANFGSKGFAARTQGECGEEVWPRVLEQALLSLNGGRPTVTVPDSYGMLTGKTAVDSRPADANFVAKLLRDNGAGKMQVLCTDDRVVPGSVNLAAHHAYSVEKIEVLSIRHADGHYGMETLVTLRNPWGYAHPRPMTTDELKQYFSAYSVADMPSAP